MKQYTYCGPRLCELGNRRSCSPKRRTKRWCAKAKVGMLAMWTIVIHTCAWQTLGVCPVLAQ